MAKHLMAVCVVCLLCADHLPCKEHFETTSSYLSFTSGINLSKFKDKSDDSDSRNYENKLNRIRDSGSGSNHLELRTNNNDEMNPIYSVYNSNDKSSFNNNNHKNNLNNNYTNKKNRVSSLSTNKIRTKRHLGGHDHHGHDHSDEEHSDKPNENTSAYLQKIFDQFSQAPDKSTLNLDEFETMLNRLGLYQLLYKNGILETEFKIESKKCISSVDLLYAVSSEPSKFKVQNNLPSNNNINNSTNDHHHHSQKINVTNPPLNTRHPPLTGDIAESANSEIPSSSNNSIDKKSISISTNDILAICPILLYQMSIINSTSQKSGCILNSSISLSHIDELLHHHHHHHDDERESRVLVWVYSSLALFGISLCGLLGVAVIPCMEKHFYNQLLQFLVALAVGTLAGDALLHLLPHSFLFIAQNSENPHEKMIYQGLIAMLGIIFFFFTERGLTIVADWHKKKQKKDKPCTTVRVKLDPEPTSPDDNGSVEKICKNRYSSYPYCYDEIAKDTKDDHHHHHGKNICNKAPVPVTIVKQNKNIVYHHNHEHDRGDNNETVQSLLPYNFNLGDHGTKELQDKDNNTISTNLEDGSVSSIIKEKMAEENYTVILREHETKHHGHTHTHGHVHSPPSSLSSVAWMVIMGDGLHNFTDGMTIGAAFSNSIAGGFSTSIAVFCHELPHEMGDFAVLLKAGMSARQAVYYNILSSVLSFIGMIVGVLIGERPVASAWIFSCAAGMFLYIALVDMMPEITASHNNERCGISQCLLQFTGMISGLAIMLVIAIYEDDLRVMFHT